MGKVAFQCRQRSALSVWQEAGLYVGYRLCRCKHVVLCHCDRVCHGMRPVRGEGDAEMIELLALGLVTVALLVYLVYALLQPEKF